MTYCLTFAVTMTKTKAAPSSKSKPTKSVKQFLTDAQKMTRNYLKSLGKLNTSQVVLLTVLFGAMILSLGAVAVAGVKLAMLYSMADNGRKSGRADGNVYMRNGRVRQMTVPSLVQNSYTSSVRNSFGALSTGWNALTEAERDTWLNASGFSRTDRFGRSFPLVGKNLYVALNRALAQIGVASIDNAPVPAGVGAPDTLSFVSDVSDTSMVLTFTPDPIPASSTWQVFATAPQTPGTNEPSSGKYRSIAILASGTASGEDIWAQYIAKFGAPAAGQKVFIKIVATNKTTGEQSSGIVASAIVTA